MGFQSEWESQPETGESPTVTRQWTDSASFLQLALNVFISTQVYDPINVLNQEEMLVVVVCFIMKTGNWFVVLKKKNHFHLFNKQQKQVPGFELSYHYVIMNESCSHSGCLALIHLDYIPKTPFTPRLNIFVLEFFFFFLTFFSFDFNITSSLLRCDV